MTTTKVKSNIKQHLQGEALVAYNTMQEVKNVIADNIMYGLKWNAEDGVKAQVKFQIFNDLAEAMVEDNEEHNYGILSQWVKDYSNRLQASPLRLRSTCEVSNMISTWEWEVILRLMKKFDILIGLHKNEMKKVITK